MVSRRVRQRRRQFAAGGGVIFLLLVYVIFLSGGSPKKTPPATVGHTSGHTTASKSFPKHSPLNPDWKGSGKAVTLAFGGDVHFEGVLGSSLAQNPATAMGTTLSQLFAGSQLNMVNLESALTDGKGSCPEPQTKPYIFIAPPTAITALKTAGVTVAAQANDHALDCGPGGLSQALAIGTETGFPLPGIGTTAAQAFAPYRATINGQRIAVISATQVIAPNLVASWEATSSQPGVASALDPTQLVAAVQSARRTSDTVVVYLHWGPDTQTTCPAPQQEPLAQQLVKAGADIVVGTNSHVLLGAGYLGSSYVDYGLGNFAFYNNSPPESDSGSLLITAVGRTISAATFRPATDVGGLPQPLSGAAAATALQSWNAARSCTNLSSSPTTSLASESGETTPFVAPTATTTTTGPAASTTTTKPAAGTTTTTKPAAATTTTTAAAGGPPNAG